MATDTNSTQGFTDPRIFASFDCIDNAPCTSWTDWADNLASENVNNLTSSLSQSTANGFPWIGTSRNNKQQTNLKLPIPRISRHIDWNSGGRVRLACENCREQKAKCSGHRPTCHKCQASGLRCSYGDRKRERTEKRLNDLTAEVQALRALLHELYPKLDVLSAQHVDRNLYKVSSHSRIPSEISSEIATRGVTKAPWRTNDFTCEDFNFQKGPQSLGFIGEHSEVSWLHRLKCILEKEKAALTFEKPLEPPSVTSVNYYYNDPTMDICEEIGWLSRPPQNIAIQLLDTYFETFHPLFPIIGKMVFLAQFRSFYSIRDARPGKQWFAVLNLIFAVAARHLEHTKPSLLSDESYAQFFSRAWRLSIDKDSLRNHPNLQQVQVEGLSAFYLLASGHINSSWKICNVAISSAVTMGLHLRNESQHISLVSKETRHRMWWALYALDTLLSTITGRPACIDRNFCTAKLPLPCDEEGFPNQSVDQLSSDQGSQNCLARDSPSKESNDSSGQLHLLLMNSNKEAETEQDCRILDAAPASPNALYFLYTVKLASVIREAIETIYAPRAACKPWYEIDRAMSSLENKTTSWLHSLPEAFHIEVKEGTRPLNRQRTSLAFLFYSTKILIHQPCLLQLISKPSREFGTSVRVRASMAVQAAEKLVHLFPDEPDLTWFYDLCPWWCALHYVMQAVAVTFTAIYVFPKRGINISPTTSGNIKKVIRWLQSMSSVNPSAHQALRVCLDFITHYKFELRPIANIEH